MAEQLVRDLATGQAIQIRIQPTLAQNNKSYIKCCALSD